VYWKVYWYWSWYWEWSLLVPVLVVVLVVRAGEVAAAVLVTRLDKIVVDLLTPETTHTNIHAGYTAVLPGEPPLPGSHLILPLRTSPLIPCTIFFSDRRRNGGKIGAEKVCNSMRGKLVQRFCGRMPFLSTTSGKENSGPHPFFNHQQTPEGRGFASFFLCSQTLI